VIRIKNKRLVPFLLIALAVLLSVLMTVTRPENIKIEMENRAVIVDVAEAVPQALRIPIQAQGTVSPHRETEIVAEVVGKVISVSPSFYSGGYVAKGDVLLQIDDVEHQASLSRAEASVASAQSNLAQEQGKAEVAKQEFAKIRNKHRSAASRDLYLRLPQLKQAQAQLLSAQADLRKAQHNLERTVVRAPYDSLIKEKQSDLGSYLSPGSPIVRLFATDFAEVRLAIPQSKLAYLELPQANESGKSATTSVDLYTGMSAQQQHWAAKLHRTEGVYDERSRVLFVVARIDDPYALEETTAEETALGETAQSSPLRMGAFVTAVIDGRLLNNLIVLPRKVLRTGDYVWVVDQQNTLRNRKVTTLRTQGDKIYVTGGLQNGDLVCLTPVGNVIEGSAVTVGSKIQTDRLYSTEPTTPTELNSAEGRSVEGRSVEGNAAEASSADETIPSEAATAGDAP
jgi:RND family efflux transporter MFP subunit